MVLSRLFQRRVQPKHYYNYQQTQQNTIRISENCVARAKDPHFVHPAWSQGLEHGQKPETIDVSGNIYLTGGVFSPQPTVKNQKNLKGSILGLAISYDNNGQRSGEPQTIDLGKALPIIGQRLGRYPYLDQADHSLRTIEIVPATDPAKLKVIEARMETTGLRDDQSKYIYSITSEGQKRLETYLGKDIQYTCLRLTPQREVEITYQLPNGTTGQLIMAARYFVDNYNKLLLSNRRAHMSTFEDFYQSDFYTAETERYQPVIDRFPVRNGSLRLILHKTETYEINRPADLKSLGKVKIYPSPAVAATRIQDRWIPLALKEALTKQDLELIDLKSSRVQAGRKQSVIGPQDRTGNMGEMSGDYPRDPTFYGFRVFKQIQHILKYGDNIAINKGKSVRAERGIESGRTHTMPYILLFDKLFADLIETNNPYTKKLSNYGHQFFGPGVSEDTQMEVVTWMLGPKMWVVNEMMARLPAEKRWGKYNIQNAVRYIFSEALFVQPFKFVVQDMLNGRFFGTQPVYMKWAAMAEITAGRTWYKWVLAQLVQFAAVPIFLGSMGHVLFFPVDLNYFILAWCARTIISTANYVMQIASLGYQGIKTGLWKNPAYEETFKKGYLRSALRQFLDRNQYATFALTVGGAGGAPPKGNKNFIRVEAVIRAASLAAASVFIVLGGLNMLAWPLGLAIIGNMIWGTYGLALNLKALSLMKRESQPDAKQITLNQLKETQPNDYAQFRQIAAKLSWQSLHGNFPGYEELFSHKKTLSDLLVKFGARNKKGNISIGWNNQYRDLANQVLDLSTSIEMIICLTALGELEADTQAAPARAALKRLAAETREFVVIDTIHKAVRLHRLKL